MGIAERREREREALRTRIVEAARDIVSEEGLDALSMRAIAERVEYSPATLYLYFKDKEELLREVVREGFRRLGAYMRREVEAAGAGANPAEQHRAVGWAYVYFALDHTAYFRVMFELPSVTRVTGPGDCCAREGASLADAGSWSYTVDTVQRAIDAGLLRASGAERGAAIAWALVHGLVSLYLGGHLAGVVGSQEDFLRLVGEAMGVVHEGWTPGVETGRSADA
ncbi:MAG TPA: TetR/AcrR family transcriptional regulator [Longimicrobiaceae bacterium]|nr:TetR/AcrR family transcriptional regulator [Longimicrobiaceae bacterium]